MEQPDRIKKWLNGTLTEEERREFEQTDDFRFIKKLDKSLSAFKAPDFNVTSEEQKLNIREKEVSAKIIPWPKMLLRVAASLLIIAFASIIYWNSISTEPTRVVSLKKSSLYLPDSSFVELNAHSTLVYDQDSWRKSRRVKLNGEAFFRVESGSQFDVITSLGLVSVVGTQFNVKNREDYFEVTCFEGKVKVYAADQELILNQNDAWRLLKGRARSVEMELKEKPDWTLGETKFQSVPYGYVLKEFERQYNVEVQIENVDTQKLFTGAFIHDNINLALESISLPLNLSYQLEEDQVRILGNQ